MALIPCRQCGQSISSIAPRCPHCANNESDESSTADSTDRVANTERQSESKGELILIAAIVGGLLSLAMTYFALTGMNPSRLNPEQSAERSSTIAPTTSAKSEKMWVPLTKNQMTRASSPADAGVPLDNKVPSDSESKPDLHSHLKSPSLRLTKNLLGEICADAMSSTADSLAGNNQLSVTCDICPSFTLRAGERAAEFTISTYISGKFFGDANEQLIAFYTGCEAHVTNFGGRIIFERVASGWQVIKIDEGVGEEDKCQKFRSSPGRDELICESSYMGHGDYFASIDRHSFAGGENKRTRLVSTGYHYADDDSRVGDRIIDWGIQRAVDGYILHVEVEILDAKVESERHQAQQIPL